MTLTAYKYERRGLLAIDPKAFFELFFRGADPRENEDLGDVVIVDIKGPLEQHAHPWCDSYEEITARVQAACETAARAVVLRIDSPGGDVAGCFETALKLRELCDAAGKQYHAYVDGAANSAAYAIASRAQSITMSMTSLVGSIGCISCRDDYSAANIARGLRVALIASGARKADGHPDAPITEAELASTQQIVDSMAGVFFDLVAGGRGLTAEAIAQFDAKVFHGTAAVAAGLADQVGTFTDVLARVAGVQGGTTMATSEYQKAKEALTKAAEGDDANAAAAKRALAAMEEQAPTDAEDPKDEPDAEGGDAEPDAEGDPAPESDEDKKTKEAPAAAAAEAHRAALKAQKTADDLRAELKARDEKEERARLIASRPDMSDDMKALLQKAPMALVREHIAAMKPQGKLPVRGVAAMSAPTQGEGTGGRASALPPTERAALDARMGVAEVNQGVANTEYSQTFSARAKAPEPAAKAS